MIFNFSGPIVNYYMQAMKRNKAMKLRNRNLPRPPLHHKGKKVITSKG